MKVKARYQLPRIDLSTLRELLVRFGEHLRPHRWRLATSVGALLGVSIVTLCQPWPLKIIFDHVLLPSGGSSSGRLSFLDSWDPKTVLIVSALSVLALTAIKGLLTYIHSVQAKIVGHRLVADVRLKLFSHVQRLPMSYHDYRETGELMTSLTGDISLLQDLLIAVLVTLTSRVLLILAMLGVMFWLDWSLGLLSLAIMPLFIVSAFQFTARIRTSARKQRAAYGKIVATVQESIAGISQVKGFAQEKVREKLIGRSSSRDLKQNVRTTKLSANYTRTVELISAVGTCLVLWLGTTRALAGEISAGDLLVFLAYLRGMHRPLLGIAKETARISKALARGEKILEILDQEAEVQDLPDAISASGVLGDIQFENVGFSYLESSPILQDFSCRIPSGRTTLIVGPTGAGKSTLAKLVLRLYKPSSGVIRLDGKEIDQYRIRSLRKRIAPLMQEAFLFRTTIAENIGFGMRDASFEDIQTAARTANAEEFIHRLPEGYETLVGEGGATLSGGQRQRIGIARAILREAPIMIFDEPATGLDVHAEAAAKSALAGVRQNRTLLIITHRLHFLDLADWVIYVRNGTVVEEGPPGELLRIKGQFHEFVTHTELPGLDGFHGGGAVSGSVVNSKLTPQTPCPPMLPSEHEIPLAPLLDEGAMAKLLVDKTGANAPEVLECRVRHVRYRPGESCLVLYDVDCRDDGEPRTVTLYTKSLATGRVDADAGREDGRHSTPGTLLDAPLVVPELGAVIREFPDDPTLPAIGILGDLQAFGRYVGGLLKATSDAPREVTGIGRRVRVIRYKPESRLVARCRLRWRTRGTDSRTSARCLVRFERGSAGARAAGMMRALADRDPDSARLSTPRVLFHDPQLNCTGVEWIPGEKLSGLLKDESNLATGLTSAARALATLHDLPVDHLAIRGATDQLHGMKARQPRLAVYPASTRRAVDETVRRLTRAAGPGSAGHEGFVHGDFHQGQLLLVGDHPYIIDLDRAYRGDTTADVGNFLAQLELLELRGELGTTFALGDRFVAEYELAAGRSHDRGQLEYWTAMALLELAFKELRRLKTDWYERAEAILDRCLVKLARNST